MIPRPTDYLEPIDRLGGLMRRLELLSVGYRTGES